MWALSMRPGQKILPIAEGEFPKYPWSALGQDEGRGVQHKTGDGSLQEPQGGRVVGGGGWELDLFTEGAFARLL